MLVELGCSQAMLVAFKDALLVLCKAQIAKCCSVTCYSFFSSFSYRIFSRLQLKTLKSLLHLCFIKLKSSCSGWNSFWIACVYPLVCKLEVRRWTPYKWAALLPLSILAMLKVESDNHEAFRSQDSGFVWTLRVSQELVHCHSVEINFRGALSLLKWKNSLSSALDKAWWIKHGTQ